MNKLNISTGKKIAGGFIIICILVFFILNFFTADNSKVINIGSENSKVKTYVVYSEEALKQNGLGIKQNFDISEDFKLDNFITNDKKDVTFINVNEDPNNTIVSEFNLKPNQISIFAVKDDKVYFDYSSLIKNENLSDILNFINSFNVINENDFTEKMQNEKRDELFFAMNLSNPISKEYIFDVSHSLFDSGLVFNLINVKNDTEFEKTIKNYASQELIDNDKIIKEEFEKSSSHNKFINSFNDIKIPCLFYTEDGEITLIYSNFKENILRDNGFTLNQKELIKETSLKDIANILNNLSRSSVEISYDVVIKQPDFQQTANNSAEGR